MHLMNSGPDAASRTALKLLIQRLPGVSEIKTSVEVDSSAAVDQPQLRSAQIVEGSAMRARRVPGVSRDMTSGFGAFLDALPRDVRHVIEFRETSWYSPDVFRLMERRRVALCLHDMKGSATERARVGPFVYARFHGATAKYGGG